MGMTRDEFKQKTVQILADPNNIADVSKLLSDIVDDHLAVMAERDAKDNLAKDLKKTNDELTNTNMQLYLKQVGAPGTGEPIRNPNEPPKKPEFKDLFDPATGRLKKK